MMGAEPAPKVVCLDRYRATRQLAPPDLDEFLPGDRVEIKSLFGAAVALRGTILTIRAGAASIQIDGGLGVRCINPSALNREKAARNPKESA